MRTDGIKKEGFEDARSPKKRALRTDEVNNESCEQMESNWKVLRTDEVNMEGVEKSRGQKGWFSEETQSNGPKDGCQKKQWVLKVHGLKNKYLMERMGVRLPASSKAMSWLICKWLVFTKAWWVWSAVLGEC